MKKNLGKEVPHVGEQRVIKMVKDFREDGLSLRRIAKLLTKFGVPTKNHAKKWHPEMIRRLLQTDTKFDDNSNSITSIKSYRLNACKKTNYAQAHTYAYSGEIVQ